MDLINRDPITFAGIILALSTAIYLFIKCRDEQMLCTGIGIFLYCVYILRIGGDFMAGRFFAIVLFCAAVVLCRVELKTGPIMTSIVVLIFYTSLLSGNNLVNGAEYPSSGTPLSGIADERGFYFASTGLLNAYREGEELELNHHDWAAQAQIAKESDPNTVILGNIGFYGLAVGPKVHIIDPLALGDALLARLPTVDRVWRIGHLSRIIPDGYTESVETGENMLTDPQLHEYYDILRNITSGDIFSVERIMQILKMNMGMYDYLINKGYYSIKHVNMEEVSKPIASGDPWDSDKALIIDRNGVNILLDKMSYERQISFFADNNDGYLLRIEKNSQVLYQYDTKFNITDAGGMQIRTVKIPEEIVEQGYDSVSIIPWGGDGAYSIGYLQCG